MSVEIRVPNLGESVTEATVAKWFKQVGDAVVADEPLVELETDKVTLEYNAPASGVLAEIVVEEGGEVEVGALLGSINEQAAGAEAPAKAARRPARPGSGARRGRAARWRPRCASCSRSMASTRRGSRRPAQRQHHQGRRARRDRSGRRRRSRTSRASAED